MLIAGTTTRAVDRAVDFGSFLHKLEVTEEQSEIVVTLRTQRLDP